MLELLLEQIGSHCLQVVLQYVTQADALIAGEILFVLEHAPAGLAQNGLVAIGYQSACFSRTYIVQGIIHLGHDVETIQYVQCIAATLTDHP